MENFTPSPGKMRKEKPPVDTSSWEQDPLNEEEKHIKRLQEVKVDLEKLGEIIYGDSDVIAIPEDWEEETLEEVEAKYEKLRNEYAEIMRELGRDPLLD